MYKVRLVNPNHKSLVSVRRLETLINKYAIAENEPNHANPKLGNLFGWERSPEGFRFWELMSELVVLSNDGKGWKK